MKRLRVVLAREREDLLLRDRVRPVLGLFAGSSGAMAWDSERPNELWLGHRDKPNELLLRDPALLSSEARRFANYPGGHNEGFPDSFKQLFRAVYDYIDTGDWNAPPPFPTFEEGHREVALCEAILHSHREHKWANV